ncbi:hypothetical protein MACH16_02580 [Marinomonas pontica]|uniref:Uncharacterized protein n=1 Tax=Marinomonas pontica TaxID=264739 RepID=A0ABN6WHV8_9GAMM|nr:hypothetical protein [Marinomonas pontica]MCW8357568.1 hypothetical protein [Marinomonas pontica]BDX01510.1 hypothetical protein MACH16_02580 [Marinomonas pontica]
MTTMTRNDKQTDQTDETLEAARNAFEISVSNFSSDHTEVVENMQKVVEILLAKKQFAEALKEIEQLKTLATSNKKIKIAMLEMKGRIKQVGARSGFRSRATKKYATKKPKNA